MWTHQERPKVLKQKWKGSRFGVNWSEPTTVPAPRTRAGADAGRPRGVEVGPTASMRLA